SGLGAVQIEIVTPRLVKSSAIETQLIVACYQISSIDQICNPAGLRHYAISKPISWQLVTRRIEQQAQDRKCRRLPIGNEVVDEAVASKRSLQEITQLR